jgi:hypothetical protein
MGAAAPLIHRLVAAAVGAALASSCSTTASTAGQHARPPIGPILVSQAHPLKPDCGPSQAALGAEVEPSLASDPRNPDHLVVVWQQDRIRTGGARANLAAVTRDGGSSWKRGALPGLTGCTGAAFSFASDPVVSIDAAGRAYVVSLAVQTGRPARVAVAVSASSDGGDKWPDPVLIEDVTNPGKFLDKPVILADRKRPGWAYAAWAAYADREGAALEPDKPGAVEDEIHFSRTNDGGKTWSAPKRVYGGATESQFSQLVELPDGALLDLFAEGDPSLPGEPGGPKAPVRLRAVRSTDRGDTWSDPQTVASFPFTSPRDPMGDSSIRAPGAVISAAAAADGTIYAVWAELHPDADSTIALVSSRDGGATWSEPRNVVHQHPQAFLPAIAVAGDLTVGVLWYGFSATPAAGRLDTDVWLSTSRDRGKTWRPKRLAGPFDMHTAPDARGLFVGDYQGLAGLGQGFAAAYVMAKPASRDGPTDLFFSRT